MKHKIEVQNLYRGLGTQRRLTWQPCLDSGKILCERPKRKRAQCKLYRRPDTHTCYLLTIAHNKDQSALTGGLSEGNTPKLENFVFLKLES